MLSSASRGRSARPRLCAREPGCAIGCAGAVGSRAQGCRALLNFSFFNAMLGIKQQTMVPDGPESVPCAHHMMEQPPLFFWGRLLAP